MADYFEEVARASGNAKAAANWILNELTRELKNAGIDIATRRYRLRSLSGDQVDRRRRDQWEVAKDVLVRMYQSGKSADEVRRGDRRFTGIGRTLIRAFVEQALQGIRNSSNSIVAERPGLFGFFVGQVMKLSGGAQIRK